MRIDISNRPSWLGTASFAAVIAILTFGLVAGLLATWTEQPPRDDRWADANERQQAIVLWGGASAAVAATLFAGWAWRAPSYIRFHAAFLAGLALLIVTYAYVRHMQHYLQTIEDVWPPSQVGFGYLVSPTIAIYSTALALILIFSALYLDRS
ncbi:MAG: hypothetical protein EOP50_08200 [Sphingobacteriales bacterium]|nr:MAG: hypothetical protein EOP50_08200 [Sphingobacteriales bacterium]